MDLLVASTDRPKARPYDSLSSLSYSANSHVVKLVNRNIVANLFGQAGVAVLGIMSTPLFFQFFGVERYGVILFFTTLLTLITFIDLGLGSSFIWRISARNADLQSKEQTSRMLSWAMLYYIAASILCGGLLIVGSEWIVTDWLTLPPEIQADANLGLKIWGLAVMFRWPITLLSGVLNGLERQAVLNQIVLVGTFARIALSIGVAKWIGPQIHLYSIIFLLCSILEFLCILYTVSRSTDLRLAFLPPDRGALRELALFSGGIALTSLAAWFIKTMDMFIVGSSLPIAEFSVYQTTFSLLTGFTLIAAAIMRAFYPRMAADSSNRQRVEEAFYRSTNLIVLTVVPAASIFVLNAELFLAYWVRSTDIASQSSNLMLFKITTVAMAINAIMQGPQILAWASGNSRLTASSNFIAVIIFVPALFWLIGEFGVVGGGVAWLLYNTMYFAIFPLYAYKHAIGPGLSKWYFHLFKPILMCFIINFILYLFVFEKDKNFNFVISVLGYISFYVVLFFLNKRRIFYALLFQPPSGPKC